ncbi:ubiquitin-conjugating enzyme/RWD-like protein [Cristinia sonorae]|uniref:E2 ubiquitin-conjugating enzyme n=1 Tax=Cristinia sonorae TaxID=1940300 RepID=A0A8K0UKH5_9AGAR|nr:ubiquitin-conjugating enzyme/RWD-like protein [Cristinia sonorae]
MPPPPSATTVKRIHREIADLKKEDLGDITLHPSDDSLFLWKATIPGPTGSVYEGGVFHVDIALGHDYPFSAPRMTFRTRIYHMNISDRGGICIDILKHNWSPALSLFKVILSLSSLLTDPNPKDPLVPSIATEYMRNRAQHDSTARHWTKLYAAPPPPPKPVPNSAPTTSKARSQATPTVELQQSLRSAASRTSETIVIDDSDEEQQQSSRSTANRTKRKRETGTADLDLTRDDSQEPTERRSRRRVGDGAGSSGGEHDVIVIDD